MKPRIFVSAVSKELKSARQLIANTLTALGYEPVWQDIFGISSDKIRPMLRQKVESCSAVLQIVGNAYGGEPREPDEAFGRVSYTQYEALYAHSIGKKVYYLVAQGDMPRDADPSSIDQPRGEGDAAKADADERRRLQQEYRAAIQGTEHIYYSVRSPSETELAVRRLKDDLERLRRGFRSWMIGVTVGLIAIALGVTGILWTLPKWFKEARKQTEAKLDEVGEKAKEEVKREVGNAIEKLTNPRALAERIRAEIMATAEKKISAISADRAGRGEKIAQIETQRDLAIERIDDLIELIQEGLEQDASPVFQRAAELLQGNGTDEALAYLEGKRKATLTAARHHAEQAKAAMSRAQSEKQLRNRSLSALLLESNLLRSKLQWDDAVRLAAQVAELAPEDARARHYLGELQLRLGRYREAEPHLRAAVKLASSASEEAGALNDLSVLLNSTNRMAVAEPLIRRALAIDLQAQGADAPATAIRLNNLVAVLSNSNRYVEAESLVRRALAIDEPLLGASHPRVALELNNLGSVLGATNRSSVAELLFRRALKIDELHFGPRHPEVARDLVNLAHLLQTMKFQTEAEPLVRRALDIYRRTYGDDHPSTALTFNNLAWLLKDSDRRQEAEPLMRWAIAIGERTYGPVHVNVAGAIDGLAQLLVATNRMAETETLLRRHVVLRHLLEVRMNSSGSQLPTAVAKYRELLRTLQRSSDDIEHSVKCALETSGTLEPITPEIDRLLGPLKPISDTLASLDRQNREPGIPAFYLLESNQPIAPHLAKPILYTAEFLLSAADRNFQNGGFDDAIVLYEEWLRSVEDKPESAHLRLRCRLQRAAALREVGELQPARDELQQLLTEMDSDSTIPQRLKGLTCFHLALCWGRLGDHAAAKAQADQAVRIFGNEPEFASFVKQAEQLLGELKDAKPPPPLANVDSNAKLNSARSRMRARFALDALPLTDSVLPLLDQILGPAKSTQEVLDALDQQYRAVGKPEIWMLPLDKSLAPYLDDLLGPLPSSSNPTPTLNSNPDVR